MVTIMAWIFAVTSRLCHRYRGRVRSLEAEPRNHGINAVQELTCLDYYLPVDGLRRDSRAAKVAGKDNLQ